ncbi:MAG: FHA domain-containing protein [Nitrospira sp.]|nr:FHA domain-containing protein [Nitrospira sp.]
MGRIVFVEVMNRRHRVSERIRVDSFPAAIGRAYTNDIILDDSYVSETHAVLTCDEEGTLHLKDGGSKNGIRREGQSNKVSDLEISGEATVRIGRTLLRIRESSYGVTPALAEQSQYGFFQRITRTGSLAFLAFIASFVMIYGYDFIRSYERFSPSHVLGSVLAGVMLFALWSGVWSLINRLVAHSFCFLKHMAVAGVIALCLTAAYTADEYVLFLFSPGYAYIYFELAGLAAIFAMALYAHTAIISHAPRRRSAITACIVAIFIFSFTSIFFSLGRSEFSRNLDYEANLKPLGKDWIYSISNTEFFEGLEILKNEVDSMAGEL